MGSLKLGDRWLLQLLWLGWRRRCKGRYGSGRLRLWWRLSSHRTRWSGRNRRWFGVNRHIARRIITIVALVIIITRRFGFRSGGLLSSNFFCGEKTATGPTRATHSMFVARFVKIWLYWKEEGGEIR